MPTTTKTDAALLNRAYGYVLQGSSEDRTWRRIFAGVPEDKEPDTALWQMLSDRGVSYRNYLQEGVMSPSYPWEGDWGRFSLKVLDDGRLRIDCGEKLRTDENVPFLKNLDRRERHDLMRTYREMSEEEMIDYLREDIVAGDLLYDYPTSRLDRLWWVLLRPVRHNSALEHVSPKDIMALNDNHTMLSDEVDRTHEGDVMFCGRVYYFDSYAVRDPVMELLTKGRIHLNVT